MREIYEHRRMASVLPKIPDVVLKRYERWKDIVQISGPQGLRAIRGFRDEALRGEWKGCRSSRLGQQYGIIYGVEAEEVLVYVLDLTAHDYRRKWVMARKGFRKARKNVEVSVGKSVRIIREMQELSQNRLEQITGIPQGTISAIENDRVSLGVERAKVLARALSCHPAVLIFPGWSINNGRVA